MKKILATMLLTCAFALPAHAAEHYAFDIKGQHAFIQFKVKHLGYSWVLGSFKTFDGSFDYDAEHPENNKVNVTIDIASLDSNHALRNEHLTGEGFFDAATFPKATFVSTSYEARDADNGVLHGKLTLRGVTKDVDIALHQVGAGQDPWGGFRRGFEGTTTLHLSDYHMKKGAMLGPVAENVEVYFSIEGIRQ